MRKTFLQLTCILLLAAVPALLAQASGGTFSGKVTNAQGHPVPNAAVTLTNNATNAHVKALTGPDGGFAINGLPPGTYQIDVETQGYKHETQHGITLPPGGPTHINITLQAGPSDIVELRGTAVMTEPTTGDVALGLATRTVRELPIIDRNFQQLIGLQTGVTWPQAGLGRVVDPQRNRFFSVNGQEAWNNWWNIDGVSNQEPFRDTAIRITPVDSIRQVDTETASFGLKHGFVGGSVDTSIMPAGTNGFHGDLFEFWSGNVLRTRDFSSSGAVLPPNSSGNTGLPAPRFVYNQPGAAGGGAIRPDKTFLYGSYQGTFANGDQTRFGTVPTAAMLTGDFSAVPGLTLFNPATGIAGVGRTPFIGNVIPTGMLNTTARTIASFFPAPNVPLALTNNFVTNTPFRNHQNAADGRLDQRFGDKASLFVRYGYTNARASEASLFGPVIGSGTEGGVVGQNAVIDFAYTRSANLISDIRMGYNRFAQSVNPLVSQQALGFALTNAGIPTTLTNNMAAMNIAGFNTLGAPYFAPENPVDNNFNWVWSVNWHKGMHNITGGVDIRVFRVDRFAETNTGLNFGPNGTFNFGPGTTLTAGIPATGFSLPFNSLAAFLLGAPSQVGQSQFLTAPTIRQQQYAGFIGDRITRGHLSLDLGLRYEAYSPAEPMSNGGAQFFTPVTTPVTPLTPVTGTLNFAGIGAAPFNQFDQWDTDALAPRIGIAYQISDKTVIRGGYTLQYFQQPFILTPFQPTTFGFANGTTGGFTNSLVPFSATLPALVPPATLVNGSTTTLPGVFVPHRADQPYVMSYNIQVQQQTPWYGIVANVGYVGNVDRHLPFYTYFNPTTPGTGLVANPILPLIQTGDTLTYGSGLTSNYNSLQVQLSKRFNQGMSFIVSYTWAHSLGYTFGNDFLSDPFNVRNNYGPLDFDRRNVLTINWLYELPWGRHGSNWKQALLGGWQWNNLFTWNGGTPLDLANSPTVCACGSFSPGVSSFAGGNTASVGNLPLGGLGVTNPATFTGIGNVIQLAGRGALYFPDIRNWDMSLFKNFHVHDRYNLQIRGEAFNLLNEPRLAFPSQNLMLPSFGQQVSTGSGTAARQVNLALKILF